MYCQKQYAAVFGPNLSFIVALVVRQITLLVELWEPKELQISSEINIKNVWKSVGVKMEKTASVIVYSTGV